MDCTNTSVTIQKSGLRTLLGRMHLMPNSSPSLTGKASTHSRMEFRKSQWSGQENHDLQHHLAIAVAGAYDSKGSAQYSPHMMQATCSLLDFSYKAQFPAHSNVSLQLMIKDLKTYYSSVTVFVDNGVCCNAKGDTIHHFRIPKHHNLRHFVDDICDHGTMDNGSSEITESLHIPTCKVTYHSTN